MKFSNLYVIFFTLIISGCIALPYEHEEEVTPILKGRVVDKDTSDPIGGAIVTMSARYHKTNNSHTVESSVSGEFLLPSVTQKSKWKVLLLLAPYTPGCDGIIDVKADGYEQFESALADLDKSIGFCDDKRKVVIRLKHL